MGELTYSAYSAPPNPLAGLRGANSKVEGKERKSGKGEKKGKKGDGRDCPPFRKFLDSPLVKYSMLLISYTFQLLMFVRC